MPVALLAADPSAQPEQMWAAVVDAAIALSRCAASGADCRVSFVFHVAGWAVISHISDAPHACLVCAPRTTPQHLISGHTLVNVERQVLVASVAAFLSHLHPDPALYVAPALDSATGADLGCLGGPGAAANDLAA